MKLKSLDKQELLYYAITVFKQYSWLGTWIFFYLTITNFTGIAIVEVTQISVMFLGEIPTGMFADRYGRKRSVVIGFLIIAIANIAMAFSNSTLHLVLSCAAIGIGATFLSGAFEALMYDYYKIKNQEQKYAQVISKGEAIGFVSFAILTILGGYLYTLDIKAPLFLTGFTFFIAAILATQLTDTYTRGKTEVVRYNIKSLIKGFKNKKLLIILLLLSSILVIAYEGMSDYQAVGYGFEEISMSFLITLAIVSSAIFSAITPWVRKRIKDINFVPVFTLVYGLIWVVGAFLPIYAGGVLAIFRTGFSATFNNISSILLNKGIPTESRATFLSTFSMLSSLPYIFTSYFIGSLIDRFGALTLGMWLGVFCLLILIPISFFWRDLKNVK